MADLLQLAPSMALAQTSLKSGLAPAHLNQTSINSDNPVNLSQIVLRWDKALAKSAKQARLSVDSLAAMQHLVKRIAQLRSNDADSAFTSAESLLPHVTQEAQAVLRLLALPIVEAENQQTFTVLSQPVQHLKTLAPWLLWSVAQSTHETVRLIEGVTARVQQDKAQQDKPWQTGVLRLMVILELKTEQTSQVFDLVTLQPAVPALPNDCHIQLQDSLLGQQPTFVSALVQRLTTQMTFTEPLLQPLFEGLTTDWLMPHQLWQSGTVKLHLGLAFSADNSISDLQNSGLAFAEDLPTQLTLKFTQAAWLEQHITNAVEHQLTEVLLQKFSLPVASNAEMTAIVKQGCAVIDDLQGSLTLASRTFAQQELSLSELGMRLLWGINRTAYEVMQLTSGIQVNLLQPDGEWSTGILRFVVYLIVRTPEQDWQFDLVQRSSEVSISSLADTTVVYSCENAWCLQPTLTQDLEAHLWQQIQQHAPEIALLKSGTEVSIKADEPQWQLGVIQLEAASEFVSDKRNISARMPSSPTKRLELGES